MDITIESVFTEPEDLCHDVVESAGLRRKLIRLAALATASAALYGATMGFFHSSLQAVVSAVKTPMLFLLTLLTCLPALHFVGLLFGSRVRFNQTTVVLMMGVCQTSILLGAFAPISLFFLLSRSEYPFLLMLHVLVFAFCGAAGLVSVHQNFKRIRALKGGEMDTPFADRILTVWMLLYMFVGTQMAYNLAPFINQQGPVTMFNQLGGNFYSYVWSTLTQSFSL